MNHYFNWYNMSDERQIRFAKMKLVGQVRQYWANIEKLVTLRRQEPIQTWDKMLKEKYIHVSYKQFT